MVEDLQCSHDDHEQNSVKYYLISGLEMIEPTDPWQFLDMTVLSGIGIAIVDRIPAGSLVWN